MDHRDIKDTTPNEIITTSHQGGSEGTPIHIHSDHSHELANHELAIDELPIHSHDLTTSPHVHIQHNHLHDPAEVKAVVNRLSRAIGHLEAVKKMVEDGKDCSEVLIQLAAVKSALNNTGKVILKEHINHCIVEAAKHGDQQVIDDLNNAIDKFMK